MKTLRTLAAAALVAVPTLASAQVVVTPGNPQGWGTDTRHSPLNNGTAAITGNQPRSGNGSLELYTPAGTDRANFAVSHDGATGFGLFRDLTTVSIDWQAALGGPASPTVRVYLTTATLRNLGGYFGFIGWYANAPTQVPGTVTTTPGTGAWESTVASGQGWWLRGLAPSFALQNRPISCVDNAGTNSFNDRMQTIAAWQSACGTTYTNAALGIENEDLFIDRVAIGIGADFTDNRVYADNLSLTFQPTATIAQVPPVTYSYNFETDQVPEPSSLLLLAAGLAGLGITARRRRAR